MATFATWRRKRKPVQRVSDRVTQLLFMRVMLKSVIVVVE